MKMFDASKTRMIGLPYGEKNYDDMLSRFHPIPERNGQTDGQTYRQTDICYINNSISRVSMLTRDKNDRNRLTFDKLLQKQECSFLRHSVYACNSCRMAK